MPNCSLLRNRRGVSEIIASLIMILVVSAGGVVVYSFSLEAFSTSSSLHELQTSQREEQAKERFLIVVIRNTTMTDQLNVTVLNYGRTELTIVAVYVNGTNSTDLTGGGIAVGTGQLTSVQFVSSIPIGTGDAYEVAVVSKQGSENVIYWKA